MEAWKLSRIEDVEWYPPRLIFTIERHGAAHLGSSRAEIQEGVVNIEDKTAHSSVEGYRQIRPRRASVFVKPIAEEIAKLIITRTQDDRLRWRADGSVQVFTGKIFPNNVPQRTLVGRRKRFRAALEEILESHGWETLQPNFFRPP